ncbi:MAG: SDR family oxidoreductase [Spirochaetaceae bacterium]
MKKQKHGFIVNTSSIAGLIPFKGQSLYNTTKFAVSGLSLTLEKEFKEHYIDISIICPEL